MIACPATPGVSLLKIIASPRQVNAVGVNTMRCAQPECCLADEKSHREVIAIGGIQEKATLK